MSKTSLVPFSDLEYTEIGLLGDGEQLKLKMIRRIDFLLNFHMGLKIID